jgi:hypothetical protein
MNLLVAASILACILAGAGLVMLIRKIASPAVALPATASWIEELSVERYRPMLRMIDSAEFRFLCDQPGMTQKEVAQMRKQRCRIFRGYLRSLSGDFNRVCTAIKILMLHANTDRPDLAQVLLRSQFTFAFGLAQVHVRLVLFGLGIGTVSVESLLEPLKNMQLELRTLVPATMAAAA